MKKPKRERDWFFEAELRRAEHAAKLQAVEARIQEARERIGAERAAHLARIEALQAGKRKPRDRRSRRPPREEGGELVPAIPRPRPTPLSGGAEAPLEFSDRKLGPARPHPALSAPPSDGDETGIRL